VAKAFKRKDGRWSASVTIKGTGKRKVIYGETEREVKREMNKLIYQVDEGIYHGNDSTTLKSLLNTWYDVHKVSVAETTKELYRMYLDVHLIPALGSLTLKNINGLRIDQFYSKKLEEGLSPNTVCKFHGVLRQAFKYAIKNGVITINPIESVTPPKRVKTKYRIVKEKEFESLLNHVEGTHYMIPIILAGAVGLRRGEVFGLKWDNIDFENKTITIEETMVRFSNNIIKEPKNDSSKRVIKVFDFVVNALWDYKESSGSDDVYVYNKYKPTSWSEKFGKLLEQFGMEGMRFHDLRHYNATLMLKYGVPDIVAAERLGHSDTTMLKKVYQHVLEDMRDEAAKKLNDVFKVDNTFDNTRTIEHSQKRTIGNKNVRVTNIEEHRKKA